MNSLENASDRNWAACRSTSVAHLASARRQSRPCARRNCRAGRRGTPENVGHIFLCRWNDSTREAVKLADNLRIAQAVLQTPLVDISIVATSFDAAPNMAFFATSRTSSSLTAMAANSVVEFQVPTEIALVRRKIAFEVEIAIPMHEKGFHGRSLSRSCRVGESIFFRDRDGVGQAVGRAAGDLERALREVAGFDVARHADRGVAERRQLVDEGDADADRVESDDLGQNLAC